MSTIINNIRETVSSLNPNLPILDIVVIDDENHNVDQVNTIAYITVSIKSEIEEVPDGVGLYLYTENSESNESVLSPISPVGENHEAMDVGDLYNAETGDGDRTSRVLGKCIETSLEERALLVEKEAYLRKNVLKALSKQFSTLDGHGARKVMDLIFNRRPSVMLGADQVVYVGTAVDDHGHLQPWSVGMPFTFIAVDKADVEFVIRFATETLF